MPEKYNIRRDAHGYAIAIERNGYTVLHLKYSDRNEEEVEGIVRLLNQTAEPSADQIELRPEVQWFAEKEIGLDAVADESSVYGIDCRDGKCEF